MRCLRVGLMSLELTSPDRKTGYLGSGVKSDRSVICKFKLHGVNYRRTVSRSSTLARRAAESGRRVQCKVK